MFEVIVLCGGWVGWGRVNFSWEVSLDFVVCVIEFRFYGVV